MKFNKNKLPTLITDYNNNMSWENMQAKYSICPRQIRNILVQNKVVKRKKKGNTGRRIKVYSKYHVNPNNFITNLTPESVYILGLLWADGYVHIKGAQCPIVLTTTNPDAKDIEKIMFRTGHWKIYKYKNLKYPSWKERVSIMTNNYPLANFLITNDYNVKSIASAEKILSQIPHNLKHYWFRGLFDGDGWLYHKDRTIQLGIASSYEQNWKFLENLCQELQIKYSIKKYISPRKHKSSTFRILGKQNGINFLNYIYKGTNKEDIYLNRKYQKYLNLIEYIKQMNEFHAKRHLNALERNIETASNSKQVKI